MTAMPPVFSKPEVNLHEPYLLTVSQYVQLGQHHVISQDNRVELIDGRIMVKPMQTAEHIYSVRVVNRFLAKILPDEFVYDVQSQINLDTTSPEPDVSIVRGPAERYGHTHPTMPDILALFEVANTSLFYDATTKQELYARNGIAVYWLINIPAQQVHVFTTPNTVAERYENETVYHVGDNVPLVLAGSVVGAISVASLFPPGEGA